MIIDLATVRLDIGGDLGTQRRRQHLPGSVTDNLIQQRHAIVGLRIFLDYREHRGRTFLNLRANAGPDREPETSDHPREGASVTPPGRERSTGSDHSSSHGLPGVSHAGF
jgi:hypothetical protein